MAAITRQTHVDGGLDTAAFTVDVGSSSDRILLVYVTRVDGAVPTGVTYNSIAMSLLTEITTGGDSARAVSIWYKYGPNSGSHQVGITFGAGPGTPTFFHGLAVSYNNVPDSTGIHATNNGTTSSSGTCDMTSGSISVSNCWLVATTQQSGGSAVAGTGTTLLDQSGLRSSTFDSNGTVSTGTPQLQATAASGNWKWHIIALKPTSPTQAVSGAITPTGAIVKSTNKTPVGSITPTGALVKQLARKLVGSLTPTGTAIKQLARKLVGSITPTGALSKFKVTLKSLAGAITPTGSLVKRVARLLVSAITPTSSVSGQTVTESTIFVYVGVVNVSDRIDFTTLTKEENPGGRSNTARFTYYGAKLAEGQEILVIRSTSTREFGGTVLGCEQFYDGIRHNIGYRVTCQDYTWLFHDGGRFSYSWPGSVSATTIAQDIIGFAAGFTDTGVEAGLDTVDDFEIIYRTRGEALDLLAERLPGAQPWKVDYSKVVHFRVTPAVVALPSDITDLTKSGDELLSKTDLGQVRTQQRGLGVRVRIPILIPSGSTAVGVDSLDRLPTSGQLLLGSTLVTFTNVTQSQAPSGIAGVAAAPTVALASAPAGGVLGAVRYAITFETPDGEYPLGAQSSQVTGATIAAPGSGTASLQYSPTSSGPVSATSDYYTGSISISRSGTSFSFTLSNTVVGARVYIFGTSSGVFEGTWTVTSVVGTTVTCAGISSSAPSSDSGYCQLVTSGPLIGTYGYKFGLLSPRGISALSGAFTVAPAQLSVSESATPTQTTGGALTLTSHYYYYFTGYTETGESTPLALCDLTTTGANNAVSLAMGKLQFGNGWYDLRIRGAKLYRGRAGEQIPRLVTSWSRASLAVMGAFDAGWTYVDTAADTALGTLPGQGGVGGAVGLTGLPSWSDGRETGLAVLRTLADGSTYYLHSTVSSASVTSLLDTMSDAELLQQSPVPADAFGGHSVNLSNIATFVGATARNIYRLFNGVWRYCGTIPDDTTTTFTDDKADDELGQPFKVGGFLTGLTLSRDIAAGETGKLHVLYTDAAAVAALAARVGSGTGVQEGPVIDNEDLEYDALYGACVSEVEVFGDLLKSVVFRSRDVNLNEGPGKNITFNLGSTTDIVGTFAIQRVVTTEYHKANGLMPLRKVTAGPVLPTPRKTLAT